MGTRVWIACLSVLALLFAYQYRPSRPFYVLENDGLAVVYVGRVAAWYGYDWGDDLDHYLSGDLGQLAEFVKPQEDDIELSTIKGVAVLARTLYHTLSPTRAMIDDVELLIKYGPRYDFDAHPRSDAPGDIEVKDPAGNVINYAVVGLRPRYVPPMPPKAVASGVPGIHDE